MLKGSSKLIIIAVAATAIGAVALSAKKTAAAILPSPLPQTSPKPTPAAPSPLPQISPTTIPISAVPAPSPLPQISPTTIPISAVTTKEGLTSIPAPPPGQSYVIDQTTGQISLVKTPTTKSATFITSAGGTASISADPATLANVQANLASLLATMPTAAQVAQAQAQLNQYNLGLIDLGDRQLSQLNNIINWHALHDPQVADFQAEIAAINLALGI